MAIKNALFLYIFSFITIALSSGLVYGYPHLRQLLYSNGCTLSESQLGLVFTVGSWTVQGGWFFSGMARDRFGTRNVACMSLLFSFFGVVGLGLSNVNNLFTLTISYFCLGLGSGGMLCFQPVASLFSMKWQGTILASFSGAFQFSGLTFLILKEVAKADWKRSFIYFSAILLCLVIASFAILPKKKFIQESNIQGNDDEVTAEEEEDLEYDNSVNSPHSSDKCHDLEKDDKKNVQEKVTIDGDDTILVTMKENTNVKVRVLDQIKSMEYIFLVSWFSAMLIPMQYYIGTIGLQLERKGDALGTYTNTFSFLYASSALFSPVMGKLADAVGPHISQIIATILIAISLLMLSFNELPLKWQWVGMTCYAIGRVTVFAMYFTSIGKRFGFTHYGTLAGLGLFISAILSLIQYPLIDLAAKGNESFVNVINCCTVLILGIPYCIWVGCRTRE